LPGRPELISASKALFLLLWPLLLAAQGAVPPLSGRVNDLTGTLTAQQRSELEQILGDFETKKGSQIAVLMVRTTKPETIEQYAVRVQESWKLGRKGVDDGVLLVVAKEDRRVHTEVGYGLEGILPDAVAKRIIDEDIVPRFKQGDFYGGIRAGIQRIMQVVEGEPLPAPRTRSGSPQASGHLDWILPGLLIVLFIGGILRAIFGRFLGSGLVGALAGGAVWMLMGSLAIALIVGLVAFFFGLVGGSGMGRGYGGMGGFGGGGFGRGGFGGGGFGGGGGRSGGGGASGSW
jgi:uncharacterized protein